MTRRDQGHRMVALLVGNEQPTYDMEKDSLGIFPKNKIKEACQIRLKQMFIRNKDTIK